MSITLEATYENGVLKPEQPLPLKDCEKVRITVHTENSALVQARGIMGWTGDAETLRYLAEDVELDSQEGP